VPVAKCTYDIQKLFPKHEISLHVMKLITKAIPQYDTYLEKNTQQENKIKCLLRNVDEEKRCE